MKMMSQQASANVSTDSGGSRFADNKGSERHELLSKAPKTNTATCNESIPPSHGHSVQGAEPPGAKGSFLRNQGMERERLLVEQHPKYSEVGTPVAKR